MRIFGKEIRWFGKDNEDKGFEIDDEGKVTYKTEIRNVKELKPFGACVFVGVVKKECIFEPAEIIVPNWRFGQLDLRRFDHESCEVLKEVPTIESIDINEPLNEAEGEDDEYKEDKDKNPAVENLYNLPVASLPCYLTDRTAVNDLAHFISYYSSLNMQSTIYKHIKNLKMWSRDLEGHLTTKKILEVLRGLKIISVKNSRIEALKAYAVYRNAYGDPRLKMILATSDTIKRVQIENKRKIVSYKEMVSAYNIARVSVLEGDKVGIWLGLILFGFRRTEFISLITERAKDNVYIYYVYRRKKKQKVYRSEVPDWLYYAYENIDKSKLKRSDSEIFKEVVKYGSNITKLHNACNYYDFDFHRYEKKLRSGDIKPDVGKSGDSASGAGKTGNVVRGAKESEKRDKTAE